MNLSPLTAAAAAAGIVSAMAVLAFSQLPGLFVWASFIGWASYDHSGPRSVLHTDGWRSCLPAIGTVLRHSSTAPQQARLSR
jgi:hypothetical protein